MKLSELRRLAEMGALLPASAVLEILEGVDEPEAVVTLDQTSVETWREKLWTVPAECRIGVPELSEALGRPRSFVYARTGPKAESLIPHRRLDGSLVFTCGEVRAWLRDSEEVVHAGPFLSVKAGGAA